MTIWSIDGVDHMSFDCSHAEAPVVSIAGLFKCASNCHATASLRRVLSSFVPDTVGL